MLDLFRYNQPDNVSLVDLLKLKYPAGATNHAENHPYRENDRPNQPLVPVNEPDNTEQDGVQVNVQNQPQAPEINFWALMTIVMLYIIPIVLIVYGIIHLHDCPAENMIDISFIVLGGLTLMTRFLNCPYECRNICTRQYIYPKNLCLILINLVFQLTIIGFFIAICYWIFSINPTTKPEDSHLPNYCEKQFYNNTWWGCVIGLVLFGIILFGGCCICCLVCVVVCCVADELD